MKRSEKYYDRLGDRDAQEGDWITIDEVKRYGKYCSLEAEKDFTSSKFHFKLAEKQLEQMAKEDNL